MKKRGESENLSENAHLALLRRHGDLRGDFWPIVAEALDAGELQEQVLVRRECDTCLWHDMRATRSYADSIQTTSNADQVLD